MQLKCIEVLNKTGGNGVEGTIKKHCRVKLTEIATTWSRDNVRLEPHDYQ